MSLIGMALVTKCVANHSQSKATLAAYIYIAAKDVLPVLHYQQQVTRRSASVLKVGVS